MSEKVWNILDEPPEEFYDEHPELPTVVARLLYHRGLRTQEEIDEFLHPDYSEDIHNPFLFNHMEQTVDRIFEAIDNDENIVIYGDYDADGVSAATILHQTLEAIGVENFDIYLPHRETEGYGLNKKTIESFVEAEADIIITCDCGISDTEEVALANEKDLDVIITDHHSIPENIPDAYSILHPKIEEEQYPDQTLSGGAVAFKLAQGLLHRHKELDQELNSKHSHEAMEKWMLDMVAIANVADMVPLKGEARTLTKYGLVVLNKTKRIGLKKLFLEAGIMEDDGTLKNEVNSGTIGFQIAPRINAAGRLNHANVAYKLMTTDSGVEATDLAYELNQNNRNRKKIVKDCLEEAKTQLEEQKNNPVLFVKDKDWKTGIVGLIASKIKEEFHKPVIAMAKNGDEEITGSGRSIKGFNLIKSLQEIPDYFSTFGGHPMACGFTLKSQDKLEDLQNELNEKFKKQTGENALKKQILVDAKIDLDNIDWELYDILESFRPFGMGNKKPKYLAEDVEVHSLKSIGSKGNHLKMQVKHNSSKIHNMIGWNLCSDNGDKNWCKLLTKGDKINTIFEIGVNEWRGNRNLQMTIKDLRKTDE